MYLYHYWHEYLIAPERRVGPIVFGAAIRSAKLRPKGPSETVDRWTESHIRPDYGS